MLSVRCLYISQRIEDERDGGLFELLCFIAACALVEPLAHRMGERYFPNHPRGAFYSIMLTIYPVLGFVFCTLIHLLLRWGCTRKHSVGVSRDENK
jgi:hypothetical protein